MLIDKIFGFYKFAFFEDGAGAGAGSGAGAGAGAGTPPAFETLIPAEYKDKPWVKEVKDIPSLFKRTDGLLSEMGKRPAGIPQDNAAPEEWDKFFKAAGRPDKPEDYGFKADTEAAKALGWDDKIAQGAQAVLHAAGLSKKQAAMVREGYEKLIVEHAKEKGLAQEKLDNDFEKLATTAFGDKRDKVLAESKILIAKYAPENVKAHVANLSNENLIILAGVLKGVREQYIKEDILPPAGGSGSGNAKTEAEIRTEAMKLMASPEWKDATHRDHDKVVKQVNDLYASLK